MDMMPTTSSELDHTARALRERAARMRRHVPTFHANEVGPALERLAADLEARADLMEAKQSQDG